MLVAALLLTAANVALWIIFFLAFNKNFSGEALLEKIRGEVNALLIDIRQETDMSATLLEGRINALKRLIDEADARTLLAQKAEENREREREVIEALSLQANTSSPSVKPHAEGNAAPVAELFGEDDIAHHAPDVPSVSGTSPRITTAPKQIKPKKSTKTAVLELAAAGFTAELIAEKLEISITEARMIINLYGK
jgi:DNA-binding NarL/FixJ family response regulator